MQTINPTHAKADHNSASDIISEMIMSMMGVQHMVYIKPVAVPGSTNPGYAVYSSEGAKLATFPSHDAAFYNAQRHNLIPVRLH